MAVIRPRVSESFFFNLDGYRQVHSILRLQPWNSRNHRPCGCSNSGAAIYCIGTLPAFRRQGLGIAVTQASLETAIEQKMPYAVLHGSNMGKLLYEKLGFRVVQIIHEYSFEGGTLNE